MGLTRPRAYQIFDIDYKQSVRVITLSNITLSGGAPTVVDGVTLSAGNRVLVAGQSTGSQNGLYQVSVLGTGSNGTWIRSVDGNETGEVEAGMIVMVTEGDVYKDTQWKLTTNDPIVIGVTALTFEQNSAFAFGNIYANGTAVLADIVGDTVTFTPGTGIAITANATSDTITFSVDQSGVVAGSDTEVQFNDGGAFGASSNFYFDKTWNSGAGLLSVGYALGGAINSDDITACVSVTSYGAITASGNLTSYAGLDISGDGTVTGNVNSANLYLSSLTANRVVFANTNGQLIDTQNFTFDGVTANIQGALIVDNVEIDSNSVSSTVGNLLLETPAGSFVSVPGNLLISGPITGNLLPSANVTYNLGSPTQRWNEIYLAANTIDIGGATISANLTTGSLILKGPDGAEFVLTGSSPTDSFGIFGLIEAGNTSPATSTTTGALQVAGGAGIGGNIFAGGIVDIAGNSIYLGNLVLKDNGSNIFGLYAADGVTPATISQTSVDTTKISNGTSNVQVVSANANVTVSVGGTSNVMVVSSAGANILGTLDVTGNITGGNLSGSLITGTLTTAAQPNVTSVGTLTSVSVTGNVTGGNLITAGLSSVETLLVNGSATVAGNLTVSGNVISVNVTDLNVVDPIIGLGRGANNTPLTTNDGKDRGEQLWYYTTAEQSAFIGYDNSAGKLIAATNVSVASEVVTVNSYGNLVVGGLESATISATGNANVGNLGTAGQIIATGNVTAGGITTAGNITASVFLGNGSQLSGINTFSTVAVADQSDIVADSISDTLTFAAGDGIVITTVPGTDTITIATAGGGDSIFATGGDMGTVTEAVTVEEDLGSVTVVADTNYELGTIVNSGIFYPDQLVIPSYTVAQLANLSATPAGQMVYCSNESGGAVPAFSDGADWRRVTDRAVIS